MRRLNDYLAAKTVKHVSEAVGKKSSLRQGLFEREGNGVLIWNDYSLSFIDEGKVIRVAIDSQGSMGDFKKRLGEMNVPREYSEIISGLEIKDRGGLEIEVQMTYHANSSKRTQNPKKLFYALFNSVVRPVLKAAYESK